MSTPLLQVSNLSKNFGGLKAVSDVTFSLGKGEIVGLLGPNGAGKTTAFNMIAGYLKPSSGKVTLDGRDITGMKPWDICLSGVARTFQLSKTFGDLTLVENLMVGGFARHVDRARNEERAREVCRFLGMGEKADLEAHNLTAFDRRKLELGRALCTEPTLLLMDEVVAGATPSEAAEMVQLVFKVRETGVTILIVEHVMKVIMSLSDRVIVLDHGELIAAGQPRDVVKEPKVLKAYFGERYVESHA